jgi:hypothetical protein
MQDRDIGLMTYTGYLVLYRGEVILGDGWRLQVVLNATKVCCLMHEYSSVQKMPVSSGA